MRRGFHFLKTTPCLMLLVVQLAGVVLYPFMAQNYAGRAAFAVFGLLVLGLTVIALRATPFFTWVGVLVGAPAAALLFTSLFTGNEKLFPWSAGFELVLYTYAGISMLAYMLKDADVSIDEMFAIPAVFTLFAWAFAYLYVVVQAVEPGAFGPGETATRSWMDLLFLSFTTLSSTGLSDIVPLTGHARSVVMLEQVAGVFYIAMVVTRLVSLRSARPEARR
jgi:Ion channel